MLEHEISIIEDLFASGEYNKEVIPSWNRIKKRLEELSKTPTNKQMDAIALLKECRDAFNDPQKDYRQMVDLITRVDAVIAQQH